MQMHANDMIPLDDSSVLRIDVLMLSAATSIVMSRPGRDEQLRSQYCASM
jgi:hypothetical protein